jgi:nucleoside-diphosphate-sugar epimerase
MIRIALFLCAMICVPRKALESSLQMEDNRKEISEANPFDHVLVTGGGGFIGSTIVLELLLLGYQVTVLDNFFSGSILNLDLWNRNLRVVQGDVLDQTSLSIAFENVTHVIHLAAASKVAPSLGEPSMSTFNVENNAVGTARVLEEAQRHGVRKFVYAASSTFYGDQRTPFTETMSFVPSSPYAASKYMGEIQVLTYDKVFDLPGVNLRFFMVYGPRQPKTGPYAVVTGKFHAQATMGLPLTIQGTGEQFRDFVHVDDVARACILALQNSQLRGETINVGSGVATSINELADLFSDRRIYLPARPHDLPGTLADTIKAEKLLGFRAERDLKEEIRRTMIEMTYKIKEPSTINGTDFENNDNSNETGKCTEIFSSPYDSVRITRNSAKVVWDGEAVGRWYDEEVESFLRNTVSGWDLSTIEEREIAINEKTRNEGFKWLSGLPGVQATMINR